MRIETELKLGFKDVMIRPKRSTLKSRAQVSLERTFTFRNSKKNGAAFQLLPQIWIQSELLKWQKRFRKKKLCPQFTNIIHWKSGTIS